MELGWWYQHILNFFTCMAVYKEVRAHTTFEAYIITRDMHIPKYNKYQVCFRPCTYLFSQFYA